MAKTKMHIEIVSTDIKSLSSMSDESRTAICAVLTRHYSDVSITMVNTVGDLEELARRKPDLVFLGMKFLPQGATKIWISDYLDIHGIAYTGSNQQAHELELNKQLAKQRIADAGLATAKFFVADQQQYLVPSDISLKFPVFIKPPNRGGGLGIDSASVAYDFAALTAKVQSIASRYNSDALIEEYLPGREFSVAILKNVDDNEFSVMPIELIAEPDAQGSRMLSQAVKCSNTEVVHEVTDPICRSQVTELALNVFHALGGRDYGRIDIRLDAEGIPHFLEANLIPSLINNYGSFPKACSINQGLDHEPMILRIVELGLMRNSVIQATLTEPELDGLLPALFDAQPA